MSSRGDNIDCFATRKFLFIILCLSLCCAAQSGSEEPLLPIPECAARPDTTNGLQRRLAEVPEEDLDVCSFFKLGYGTEKDESSWAGDGICSVPLGSVWAAKAAGRCRDCQSAQNLCADPPQLLIHQYLNRLDPDDPLGNLVSIKAYLLTQNLDRTHLILWADNPENITTDVTRDFFTNFKDKVTVKQFNYDMEIRGTVLEGDAYFGSEKTVKAAIPPRKTASYSDLVRYVLLHNYGGLWIDGDAVLMRDVYPITVLVGYQFAMRWMNAHIFYVKKGSALSRRILDITRTMPLNHPEFTTTIVDKVCRHNGYFPVVDMEHYTDLWAFCVLRVAIRNNNTGDSDNILYDHPLGWWDTEWPGSHKHTNPAFENCYRNDELVNDTYFQDYVGRSMGMHTRYPGHDGHRPQPGSPLGRVIGIINEVFGRCNSTACIPAAGVPMVDYWRADNNMSAYAPVTRHSSSLSTGGQATEGGGLHTEPDLVDAGLVGGNPKAGMPTGSHAAAASSAATGKTPKFVPEGAALKAGMPTGAESLEDEFSRATPGAELAARKAAAQGVRALDRQLDKEFGVVSTTSKGAAAHFAGAEQDSAHGARDGLHELVPGDADMVVAPKEAIEEVEGKASHQGSSAGSPASHDRRTKHHKNKWWAGR